MTADMFTAIDVAVDAGLSQMKLYCELGRLVCERPEKGAAVAAAEHLHSRFPAVSGFSPCNLRRMREFYRMYTGNAELLALAMKIAWTQNVVILEADLEIEERRWYLRAADQNRQKRKKPCAAFNTQHRAFLCLISDIPQRTLSASQMGSRLSDRKGRCGLRRG